MQYNANKQGIFNKSKQFIDLQIHGLKITHSFFSEFDGNEKSEYIFFFVYILSKLFKVTLFPQGRDTIYPRDSISHDNSLEE